MSQLISEAQPLMSSKSTDLQGVVEVPGDKSISHRALMAGALAQGVTEISGLLESDDVINTAGALRAMGVSIVSGGGKWIVTGSGLGGLTQPGTALDFGNSGTGARLMMGVVSGHAMRAVFAGDASLSARPMGRVLEPLLKMGLNVAEDARTTLPLTLRGTPDLVPIAYATPVPSAQVKSAVLFAGLLAPGETSITEIAPTRDHTEKMLRYLGARIDVQALAGGGSKITIQGQHSLTGKSIGVPGDPSSAAFLTAGAILCGGSDITIENVLVNRARTGFYETVAEMGADVTFDNEREVNGEPVAALRIKSSVLRGVRVPAGRAPSMIDEYPVLAVLAAFAEGQTIMDGLGELRVKESDRLAAIIAGLRACGVEAVAQGDTLAVSGARRVPGGATIVTHGDHRIAMAFLILGLAAEQPVTVDNGAMIATSFPQFRTVMAALGASIMRAPARAET